MASLYQRLREPGTAKADTAQELREVMDAGSYSTLQIDTRVLKSGTAGNIILQHAATNEEDAYRDLSGATWALTGSGSFVTVDNFLRFVRWRADSSVAGNPVVMIDVIAKE